MTLNFRMHLSCALTSLLLCTLAPAQTTPTTAATTRPNNNRNGGHITTQPGGGLILNFKDAPVDVVLDELSAAAGFIVFREVRPEGTVNLVSKQPLQPADAISALNSALKSAGTGYAAIQQGRILKIVSREKAKTLNIPVRTGSDPTKIDPTDELITQVIPLRSTDAMQLKNDLLPMISPEASFTSNASSNSLIITDSAANIRRIVEIVSAMDASEAGAAEFKVIQLVYASASSTAKLINDLFGDAARSGQRSNQSTTPSFGSFFRPPDFGSSGVSGSSSGREGRREGQTPTRAEIKVTASSDDRTNTVVVVGPKDTINVIAKMVQDLDANPAAESSVFIYHLRNGQALNVQDVVNYLFNGQPGATPTRTNTTNGRTSGIGGSTRSGGFGGLGGSRTGGGSLGGGGALGSLGGSSGTTTGGYGSRSGFGSSGFGGFGGISSGFGGLGGLSSGAMQSAQSLAGQVSVIADPDTNSLLIRTSPKNFESVKLILSELDRPVRQVLIKVLVAEVSHTNSADVGVELSALNLRASGGGQSIISDFGLAAAQATNGGLIARVVESNFEATIRLLQQVGKLDVLSRPYILASDNQLASIIIGQVVPIPTDNRVTDTGQTISSVEYTEIGIILNVTPHINPEGLVILDVNPEISSFSGQSVPTGPGQSSPIFNIRSADSRVGILNGKTIVIGGLMEDRKTSTVRKTPILGDLPLIGAAFRREITEKTKTELLIFLTPHVAEAPDLLKEMSEDEMKGTKLTPKAIEPGAFQDHMRGMQRGATPGTTQPAGESSEDPSNIRRIPLADPKDSAPAPEAGPTNAPPPSTPPSE